MGYSINTSDIETEHASLIPLLVLGLKLKTVNLTKLTPPTLSVIENGNAGKHDQLTNNGLYNAKNLSHHIHHIT